MVIVFLVLIGLVLGLAADSIDPPYSRDTILETIFLGIGGALLGGLFAGLWYGVGSTGYNSLMLVLAGISAVMFLFIGRIVSKV